MESNEHMIDIGGHVFILDLDKFTEILSSQENKDGDDDGKITEIEKKVDFDVDGQPIGSTVTTRYYEKGKEIDGPKYDMLRMCLEILLSHNEDVDDKMGLDRGLSDSPIPFKLAYNTLLGYGILVEVESE